MLRLSIMSQQTGVRLSIRRAAAKAARAAARFEKLSGSVTLLLTNDERMRALNAAFRQMDKPTDVLSFPSDDKGCLGDIAISLPCAQRQAADLGHTPEREVAFLTVHAMLHLAGYDHETNEDETDMCERQKQILRKAGFLRHDA